jgi:oxalate decarboxylase/phosphoglucose isomerase-like protein (cupin superfamily)
MKRLALVLLVTAILSAQSAPEVEIDAEPHHQLIFANDQVRVFNVEVAPQTDTLMHWHRHDYVYVQIGASEVINAVKGKDPVNVKLHDGQTGFMSASFAHVARNTGGTPFRNFTIELLQDDKLRQGQSHWDEERGLDVLQGGTKEILWVKDGVRASEVEIQPGGVIPQHHHAAGHIVVTLTDVEFRNEVVGKAAATVSFKAGEAHWVPGGFTHTLTNIGHNTAKFVTLELP